MKKTKLKHIEELIQKGKVKQAFDKASVLFKKSKDLNHLQSRFNILNKDKNRGVISHPEFSIEQNKIIDAFFEFLREAEEERPLPINSNSNLLLLLLIFSVLLAMVYYLSSIKAEAEYNDILLVDKDSSSITLYRKKDSKNDSANINETIEEKLNLQESENYLLFVEYPAPSKMKVDQVIISPYLPPVEEGTLYSKWLLPKGKYEICIKNILQKKCLCANFYQTESLQRLKSTKFNVLCPK